MGRLKRNNLIESAVFLLIVAVFFGLSFEFNQPIEIYIFGATAWPRAIIGLLLVATLGNFWFQYKHGTAVQRTLGSNEENFDFSAPGTMPRMVAVLFNPFFSRGY